MTRTYIYILHVHTFDIERAHDIYYSQLPINEGRNIVKRQRDKKINRLDFRFREMS